MALDKKLSDICERLEWTVRDAEAIDKMLQELAAALAKEESV